MAMLLQRSRMSSSVLSTMSAPKCWLLRSRSRTTSESSEVTSENNNSRRSAAKRTSYGEGEFIDGFDFAKRKVMFYSQKEQIPVKVDALLKFSQQDPKSTLITSARFLNRELPIRLSQCLMEFYKLPYIIGCNPHFREVYKKYAEALNSLSEHAPVLTNEDQIAFSKTLENYLDDNMDVITMLAKGTKESSRYVPEGSDVLATFLRKIIQSRIGMRVLIENQIALNRQAELKTKSSKKAGVIGLAIDPKEVINKMTKITSRMCHNRYGRAPKVILKGHLDAKFSYVQPHLEYILQELLKNAMRASVEANPDFTVPLAPIRITLCKNDQDFIMRISDEGGGIDAETLPKCWQWSFTTVDDEAEPIGGGGGIGMLADQEPDGKLAGLGFGMPMTKMYCTYFGGSLNVQSMHNFGTDVYVRLKNLTLEAKDQPLG